MFATRFPRTLALSVLLLGCVSSGWALSQGDAKPVPLVVEGYYRVKWGYTDEFLALYKKNHLPVLKKLQEEGRLLRIEAEKPRYHAGEETRWDYRVRLTFRDAAAAHNPDHEDAIKKTLYPDGSTLRKEEARRFEILDAHWDVIVDPMVLDAK
jgi:hypothetical protein